MCTQSIWDPVLGAVLRHHRLFLMPTFSTIADPNSQSVRSCFMGNKPYFRSACALSFRYAFHVTVPFCLFIPELSFSTGCHHKKMERFQEGEESAIFPLVYFLFSGNCKALKQFQKGLCVCVCARVCVKQVRGNLWWTNRSGWASAWWPQQQRGG